MAPLKITWYVFGISAGLLFLAFVFGAVTMTTLKVIAIVAGIAWLACLTLWVQQINKRT
jgi:hypothetical protein